MNLTTVILTKDEEENIARAIRSVNWSSEIIIIDDYSTDSTISIAKELGAKVYTRNLNSDFSSQRNFALSKAQNDWVFFIDADEQVSKELAQEVKDAIKQNFDGFLINRQDVWLGKKLQHGEFGKLYFLRLAKKNRGIWKRNIHEKWVVEGRVGKLSCPLFHYPHPTIKSFLESINFHSNLHAKENEKEAKPFFFLFTVTHPLVKFFDNFILKRGYLDGTHGFVASVLMSFHSYLSWNTLWTSKNSHKNTN